MRISTNWIKDYVDLTGVDLNDLAKEITKKGTNVESIEKQVEADNLVIGKVLTRKDHINSDHLNVCDVDLGDGIYQIVCGAPNIDAGQKVIVSRVGTILPGGVKIEKSVIRGVESNGMVCALSELGMEDQVKGGIHVLPEDAPVGENPLKYMQLDDTIYSLDLKTNRNDYLSHLGFAYETAAVLKKEVKMPDLSFNENEIDINKELELNLETDACSLITLKLVKNVEIKETPDFIKNRLIASGMRSINNLVDISNYVMFEYGQPLHFYDADKVGKYLSVRMAHENEELITLDNKKRILTSSDIVIANKEKAIALAGIMGGLDTEVDLNTKNILIESAIFNPLNIRHTSIKTNLRSEASLRFEKGLNSEWTYSALKRAAHLLEKYASGSVCSKEAIIDNTNREEKIIEVTLEKINKVIGVDLTVEEVIDKLERLSFPFELVDETFKVKVPNRRMDVKIKEDLIEEIGRIYGYDNIKSIVPFGLIRMGKYEPRTKFRKDISKYMRSLGLNEVKTYTLESKESTKKFNYEEKELIELNKPISSDRTHIRTSIIPALIETFNYNNAHGVKDINIYEISNIYYKENNEYKEQMKLGFLMNGEYLTNTWQAKKNEIDFYLIKGITENLLKYLNFEKRFKFTTESLPKFMHPGISATIKVDNEIVGYIGRIHPIISKENIFVTEINLDKLFSKKTSKLKYIEPNKYPSVKKDVAFLFEKNINVEDVKIEISKNSSKILTNIKVFDVYQKEDQVSIAFNLTFENYERTLRDEEVTEVFNKIINAVVTKFNAALRNK